MPDCEPAERWKSTANPHLDLGAVGPTAYHRAAAEIAVEILGDHPGDAEFIDVGCGLGQTAELVRSGAPSVRLTLYDQSPECLGVARLRVPGASLNLLDLESATLPASTARFAVVVSSHVIEHLESPRAHLEELMGAAGAGGVVILVVPNVHRLSAVLKSVLRRHYANRGHMYAWDRSHLRCLLEERLGLGTVEYRPDVVELFPARWQRTAPMRWLERVATKTLPWLSISTIAVIRVQRDR